MWRATRVKQGGGWGVGGRIVNVGTTTVRAMESLPESADSFQGETSLLITPGHTFRWTDALITNFHLPRSTLLALVAALFDTHNPGHGAQRTRDIYGLAVREKYRFYSYGDAMLILP